MGAIYVLNDTNKDDTYFEMMTSVAYEREKMLRHTVKPQEGLVGRCAHESLTIHLREIPEDYIKVTSGLGESNPRTLILVPFKVNEQVMGVMELVSFNEFEDYHIDFLEKAGETIASDISTTKINQQTEVLLKQSQRQAEELSQQEEEMRQNMEEIQATQESLKESQAKTQMIFDNVVDAIVSIDARGMIELWNPAAEKLFGYTESEVLGKNVKIIMYGNDANEHDNYIKRYMQTGQRHVLGKPREVMAMHKTGRKFPVELLLEEGRLGNETKFVAVLRDVQDKHKLEKSMQERIKQLEEVSKEAQRSKTEMELLINGVKEVSLYAEYNMERKITDINKNFLKLIGKDYEEMLGVQQGVFESNPEKVKEFDKMWADLKAGKTRKIVQKVMANGKTLYFSEVYIPVKDANNQVAKVINLAIDITDSIKKHK
jgi:methyl-accepting chemotaxis protein